MKNYYSPIICFLVLIAVYFFSAPIQLENTIEVSKSEEVWSSKKIKIKSGKEAYMKPDGFIEYYNSITKTLNQSRDAYKAGYQYSELQKSLNLKSVARSDNLSADFISRGPGNVGGRTRAIAIDPDDNTNCTWFAGAASGGIWKTTDCGQSWENLSPDLPNLSTNSIAQSQSNPSTIYVGTGEVFAGNTSFVRGNGIYRSVDRGESWELLPSTVADNDYLSVNRLSIDPTNENVVLIATNSGIFKSTNGGASWDKKYSPTNNGSVQDLQVNPNDWNIQYAGVNSLGIIKSTDGGESWSLSSSGIDEGVRFEIAVSPSDPEIVYTSTFSGSSTLLYLSEDMGENWILVDDPNYNTDFLGDQGWYDNTIAVNPYNPYEVFVGGVSIGKYTIDSDNIGESERQFVGIDFEENTLIELVNFEADFNGGSLDIAGGTNSPSQDPVTVEIRFGNSNQQKAHRYTVPAGATSNVDISDYSYEDYVDVPFEVWDIENDRQLMVSFRDQEDNGVFDLNKGSESDAQLSNAREYLYIHDVTYSDIENNSIAQDGALEFANMYFFWPILAETATWNSDNLSNSIMRINYGSRFVAPANAIAVYDAYGNYENQNQSNLHPDHHHLTLIKTDEVNQTFMIVNGNDGGFGISTDNGERIDQITDGYITTQFYGADKKPGEEKYIGGMQDNGTWVSSGTSVDESNFYNFAIGGDGFEVIWHATDPQKVIGGYQFNGIRRSTNGGQSFTQATSGITDGPFITRLAGSATNPDVIYAIGPEGVYKSLNFGQTWSMKEINNDRWGGTASASDVEVSLANDQIVWAGAGMANGVLNLFVSTDAGETYEAVNNYAPNPQAYYTGIYTHPKEENTAYALFSRANFPKVLKTTDLGQTWEDISGFEGNSNGSDRGFPDVIAHSLLVMPFDTDIIWVGTEIGLYESLDGGETWNIRDDFPAVSVWSMKIVDDEVVIGTHGRGIWSAIVGALGSANIALSDFNYLGYGNAQISFDFPVDYTNVKLVIDNEEIVSLDEAQSGENLFELNDFYPFDGANVKIVATFNEDVIESQIFSIPSIDANPIIVSQESSGSAGEYQIKLVLKNNEPYEKIEVLFDSEIVYTDEQMLTEADGDRIIEFDYNIPNRNILQVKGYILDTVFTAIGQEPLVTSSSSRNSQFLRIYPNPAKDFINVDHNNFNFQEVKIYNSTGALIMKSILNEGENSIRLDSFDEGVYLFQFENDQGKLVSKRVIKE
ncbi:T9SS type A sorting domain-containing protein [Marivirga harenae]|uniref:T9SS type A sorting domain-containing protein n=1 Tax=Marivirga harenae TaxID=2010992 RepID=UPI0026DF4C57|nr:T9SS type A sorting domain-containing protein [Marivirga harenae]WKV11865.1 T9SS type A sorting domain-containing protein [Marivirga harenae]